MPEAQGRGRRRSRNERLPFPDLDLREGGFSAFEITLPINLRRESLRQLRKLEAKTTADHVWSSKTYHRLRRAVGSDRRRDGSTAGSWQTKNLAFGSRRFGMTARRAVR
jgi:hypothetical protein